MAGKDKKQLKGRTPSYDRGKGQAEIFLNALLYIIEEENESNNPFATWDQYFSTHLWVKKKTLRELEECVKTWISQVGVEKVLAELRTSEARVIIQNEIGKFDKEYIRNALLSLDKLDILEDKRPLNNSRTKTNSKYWTFVLRLRCNFDKEENLEWLFGQNNEWEKRRKGEEKLGNIQSNYSFDQKVINKLKGQEVPSNQTPSSNREEHPNTKLLKQSLSRWILDLNFSDQKTRFNDLTENSRIGAFLVHGQPGFGQEVLIEVLYRYFLSNQETKRLSLDMSPKKWGQRSSAMWYYLRSELRLGSVTTPTRIAETVVCDWWKTQNVLFVVNSIDCMSDQTLSDLIEEFWQPIVNMAYQYQDDTQEETRLILLLVDYEGKCGSLVKSTNNWQHEARRHLPVVLPSIEKFPVEDIGSWLTTATQYSPILEGLTADTIFSASNQGIPDDVYRSVCQYCNWNWEGDVAQWLV